MKHFRQRCKVAHTKLSFQQKFHSFRGVGSDYSYRREGRSLLVLNRQHRFGAVSVFGLDGSQSEKLIPAFGLKTSRSDDIRHDFRFNKEMKS